MRLLFLLLAFILAVQEVVAEEWRGLKPLRSTRADVVRLFGECADDKTYCEFTIDNEDISINFSGNENCNSLPPGTVLSIQRELANATTFQALHLDPRRFKSFNPSKPLNLGYRGFIDEESGLLLKSFQAQLFQINYIAGKKERQLCPGYYSKPREFVAVYLPHVPVIQTVDCPPTVTAGEKVMISAFYASTGERFFLTWEATNGRIIKGQTMRKIWLDTTGVTDRQIIVSVELNDGLQHTAFASCTMKVLSATAR